MRKREFIEKLFTETADYKNSKQAETVTNLLNTVSSDIYSEGQRFVFELIQNADDAAIDDGNEILFEFYPNNLIVSHKGVPFNENDINSLTSAGDSTKKREENKTGYKGIGFKSVFSQSNRVTIFSDGYQFRFDKNFHQQVLPWQIIPIWTELQDLPAEIRTGVSGSSYNVVTILEIPNANKLLADLKALLQGGQLLLFLRKVKTVKIINNGNHEIEIKKQTAGEKVDLLVNNIPASSWITRKFPDIPIPKFVRDELVADDKIPEKLRTTQTTELSFAALVSNGEIKALVNEESLIYTYLPTKVNSFKFPFLINGNFLTNAAREVLHEDKVWNQWMFELVADKMFEWLSILAHSEYKFQLLNLLPERFDSTIQPLRVAFNNGFQQGIIRHAFIITKKDNVKKIKEVLIDNTELSEQSFINPVAIIDYIQKKDNKTYDTDCFLHKNLLPFSNKLIAAGVDTFRLENLDEFFTSDSFTSRHPINANIHLIRFFKQKADNDSTGDWNNMLKTLPFIYNDSATLAAPSTGVCFPVGVNDSELGRVPLIHEEVFREIAQDGPLSQWLANLGVQEPGDVAYVTTVLIPNIHNDAFVNEENYLRITKFLLRLYNNNELSEEILNELRILFPRIIFWNFHTSGTTR